ncbi:RNA-directed DNA polymerase, eukaryota, reverse transcriptase zinc-binding domain protein [Tanacetum coccineum]
MGSTRRNFLNGIDKSERKITWIGWKKVLAYKKYGGLGVSSFFALNRALLFKWIWRLIANGSSLWSRVIKAIYGDQGNGENTLFWDDYWLADSTLKHLYPRLYALELNKYIKVADKLRDFSLVYSFRRTPRGGIEEDQLLKSVRIFIDDLMLPKEEVSTRWVKCIPIKVNIFAWKVYLEKLPTRLNLSLRGIDISSILCPLCCTAMEFTSHILFSCYLARQILSKVARWWELEYLDIHSYGEWLSCLNNIRFLSI